MKTHLFAFLLWCGSGLMVQTMGQPAFRVVPLGVKGGIDESNLSAYLVAPHGTDNYLCLDAGTLHYGIQKAIDTGTFSVPAATVLRQYIKGYCISHGHLDHIAGLIINSPDDSAKNIYGLPYCLDIVKDKYFTWKSWANFTDAGDQPQLKKYHYVYLNPGEETPVAQTSMTVKAFPLSHVAPYQSTAFLVKQGNAYLLYLGDTGADEIEKSDKLQLLWQAVAPLLKSGQLKGIFIEVSFPDEQPSRLLFGHLTPQLLMKEMQVLNQLSSGAAKNLPVVITHIKPVAGNEARIRQELLQQNALGLHIIFPVQGESLDF